MIRRIALLLLLLPTPAQAGTPAVLAAVGRLELGGRATCSGTLIAPDLVLTAGHCLIGDFAKQKLTAERIEFHPGRSPGLPRPASYPGRVAAVHPIFGFGIGPVAGRMGFDFGLLRLAQPVPGNVAVPLPLGSLPLAGEALVIAGYRGGPGEIARQRSCPVIEANHAFAALGCEVDNGESGSPMLRVTEGGPEVVGVLANKGLIETQPVGFGPVTETAFDTVTEHLRNLELLAIGGAPPGLDAED